MQSKQAPKAKDRTAAILLAAVGGLVSWAYTYKKDKLKFWICLAWYGLVVIAALMILRELYATVDLEAGTTDLESIRTKAKWLYLSVPVNMGFWVWAVIDAVRRPDAWYKQYPNYSE